VITNGVYTLHSAFERAANYVRAEGALLSLVEPVIGAGPGNVIVSALPSPVPTAVVVDDHTITFGGQTISRAEMERYDPHLIIETEPAADDLETRCRIILPLFPRRSLVFLLDPTREGEFETDSQQALRDRIKEGVRLLIGGDYAGGVRILKGLGLGLTPSGDDFLCGFLYALGLAGSRFDAIRDSVYETAKGENPIVNHFLKAAHEGLFFEQFKNFTRAFYTGSDDDTRAAFKALLAVGATSGADTAVGLIMGFRHQTEKTD
jgi:hypothetical protein